MRKVARHVRLKHQRHHSCTWAVLGLCGKSSYVWLAARALPLFTQTGGVGSKPLGRGTNVRMGSGAYVCMWAFRVYVRASRECDFVREFPHLGFACSLSGTDTHGSVCSPWKGPRVRSYPRSKSTRDHMCARIRCGCHVVAVRSCMTTWDSGTV